MLCTGSRIGLPVDYRSNERLIFFSDAVFAIAITLLVLEIKVPPAGAPLARSLLDLWPSYVAYAISFFAIGAIWLNHHKMYDHIVRVDDGALLINLLQLMIIGFIPFPTAVLAESLRHGADASVGTAFYGATLLAFGIIVNVAWRHAAKGHRLLHESLSPDIVKRLSYRYLAGPFAYLIATSLAFVSPWIALVLFFLIHLFFVWPQKVRSEAFGV